MAEFDVSQDIRRRTNMFPSPFGAYRQGMDIFNDALGQARAGDLQRSGALALHDEQANRAQALQNWLAAEGIRHHQESDAFFGQHPEFFSSLYPGQNTAGIGPGTEHFFGEATQAAAGREKQREERARMLTEGAQAFPHFADPKTGQMSPQSPLEQEFYRMMGIPIPTNAPSPGAAPKPPEVPNVPFGGARAMLESAAPVVAGTAAYRLGPLAARVIPGLSKIPRIGPILGGVAALGAGSLTEGGIEELDPLTGEARRQHPFLGLLGAVAGASPLTMHGRGTVAGTPNAATALAEHAAPTRAGSRTNPIRVPSPTSPEGQVPPTPTQPRNIPVRPQFGPTGPVPILGQQGQFNPQRTQRPFVGGQGGAGAVGPIPQNFAAIKERLLRSGFPPDMVESMSVEQLMQFGQIVGQ